MLEVRNLTRQVVLAHRVYPAFTFWKRLKGLLGKKNFFPGEGLLLKPCAAVHSWFMSFPFDVIFLDEGLVVVHIIESMPPFRISPVIRKAQAVLELPAGVISCSGTRVGDQLGVSYSSSGEGFSLLGLKNFLNRGLKFRNSCSLGVIFEVVR